MELVAPAPPSATMDPSSLCLKLGYQRWLPGGGWLSNQDADSLDNDELVTLSPSDKKKVTAWYKDIAYSRNSKKTKQELDDEFNAHLGQFLRGDQPDDYGYGQNQRILGRYFKLAGDDDCLKLEYFLKVYMHDAASGRADDASWVIRAGILITLAAPAFGFLSQTWVVGGKWIGQISFTFFIVWGAVTVVWFIGSSYLTKWLMRTMRWLKRR